MTILHLVQKPQLRGAEVFTAQLASHTRRNGHRAIIVFLYPGTGRLPFNGKTMHLNGNKKRRFLDLRAWARLAAIIKKEQPDIVQCNAGDTLKYAVFSKIIFGWKQPLVFRNASMISRYVKNKLSGIWNGFFFMFARRIISVSNTSANDFVRLYPRARNRIVTIPVGIDYVETARKRSSVWDRNASTGPVLLHVGGFTYEKNHIGLIRIFERIHAKIPSAKLQLVGDGPLKKDIEATVKHKGLENQVLFYGARRDALQFIDHADVLLLPSIIEGLPAVIAEAFFLRTPVVAYDVGGTGELVVNGRTGRLIKPDDEAAFAQAVLAALENNSYNEQLLENAYRLVKTEYMNFRIAKKFIKEYKAILRPSVHAHE